MLLKQLWVQPNLDDGQIPTSTPQQTVQAIADPQNNEVRLLSALFMMQRMGMLNALQPNRSFGSTTSADFLPIDF